MPSATKESCMNEMRNALIALMEGDASAFKDCLQILEENVSQLEEANRLIIAKDHQLEIKDIQITALEDQLKLNSNVSEKSTSSLEAVKTTVSVAESDELEPKDLDNGSAIEVSEDLWENLCLCSQTSVRPESVTQISLRSSSSASLTEKEDTSTKSAATEPTSPRSGSVGSPTSVESSVYSKSGKDSATSEASILAQKISPSSAKFKTIYNLGLQERIEFADRKKIIGEKPVEISIMGGNYKWSVKLDVTGKDTVEQLKITTERLGKYLFDDKIELCLIVNDMPVTTDGQFFFLSPNSKETVFLLQFEEDSEYDGIAPENLVVYAYYNVYPGSYIWNNYGHELDFLDKARPHDRVLLIQDKKVHVMSIYLAIWSKHFDHLFFGNSKTKNQKEIELHGVELKEFQQLMDLIHPNMCTELDDSNVVQILKLAGRFEMPSVMSMCGKYLSDFGNCDDLTPMDRLELADTYMLADLQIACLDCINDMEDKPYYCIQMRERTNNLSKNCLNNLS